MKKNFMVSGVKGECLTGFTGKKSYKLDKVSCNEHSSYINWLRIEAERALIEYKSIYPTFNRKRIL